MTSMLLEPFLTLIWKTHVTIRYIRAWKSRFVLRFVFFIRIIQRFVNKITLARFALPQISIIWNVIMRMHGKTTA